MTSQPPFKLSCELAGHSGDVRSVASLKLASGADVLLSASRDKTAKAWSRAPGSRSFEEVATFHGHQGYVNAAAFVAVDPQGTNRKEASAAAQVYAVTSGADSTINAYEVVGTGEKPTFYGEPSFTLLGHEQNVCALDSGPKGSYVVSGSWDKTAKVWKDWKCVATFKGHLQAVWAVLAVDEDRVITASADKTIRLWSISNPSKPIAFFSGHTDAVRGLTLLPGGEAFASCGNDALVCVHSLETSQAQNKPLLTLSGHTSFAYAVTALNDGSGQLASSGEDRSVRIWHGQGADGSPSQTLTLPAISVWTTTALSNGDLATGSNDGAVRVFSRVPALQAPEEEQKVFEAAVASQELNKTQIGDVKLDQMAGLEALSTPGKKEGEVKIFRNGDKGEAYQWTMGTWQKIGDVVGGVGQNQKQLYQGKEYDYVFDVDIAEGAPPLKLPYNLGENPYFAAQRFIDRNELPQSFLEQIVHFIDQNTDQSSRAGAQSSGYVDPYTGASRYTGGPQAPSQGTYTDPFTGANRYSGSTAPAPSAPAPTTGNPDPFTSSAKPQATATPAVLPQQTPLAFKQFNPAPVKTKVAQLAQTLGESSAPLESIIDAVAANGTQKIDISVLEAAMQKWPIGSRFPLLDVYRMAAAQQTSSSFDEVASTALSSAAWSAPWPTDAAQIKERDTVTMLALRALANLFARKDGLQAGLAASSLLINELSGLHFAKLSKNGRIAFATVAMNSAVAVYNAGSSQAWAQQLLQLFVEILSSEESDSEVVFRALVGIGTLIKSKSGGSLSVDSVGLAKDLAASWAQRLSAESRIVSLQQEIA